LKRLLLRLDPNPVVAQEKYVQLHRKLLRFFEWRGCRHPDEATDDALDRLKRKLGQGKEIPDVHAFVFGVAVRVAQEHLKKQKRALRLTGQSRLIARKNEDPEREYQLQCLDLCIAKLPLASQHLIRQYYAVKDRAELASSLSVNLNVLRIRACRIRDRIEECFFGCLERVPV
jgi:DNA-directed RNA polymerase specialized sigma24 family protein